jgi:hypothetical protein
MTLIFANCSTPKAAVMAPKAIPERLGSLQSRSSSCRAPGWACQRLLQQELPPWQASARQWLQQAGTLIPSLIETPKNTSRDRHTRRGSFTGNLNLAGVVMMLGRRG